MTRASTTRRWRRRHILVVENDPERLAHFRSRFGLSMVEARDYPSAMAALAGRMFEEVWLDFDLDGRKNGADVAYWMTRNLPRRRRPKVIKVHSTNLAGAHGITLTLRAAGFLVTVTPYDGRP